MKSDIPSFRPQRPFRSQTCHSQRLEQEEEEYLLIQKGIGFTSRRKNEKERPKLKNSIIRTHAKNRLLVARRDIPQG